MDAEKFVLYAYTFPSRAERVLWTLRELGHPYELIRLDPYKGETRTAEFSRLNPSRKIPVLVHGDDVFTESLAIMEYLNEVSVDRPLVPKEAMAAYRYKKVVHYGLTEVESYLWVAEQSSRLKALYHWPDGSYESAIKQATKNLSLVWPWIENTSHIVGEEFSLADIYYYNLVTWAKRQGIGHSAAVGDYLLRLEGREAFPGGMLPVKAVKE